MNLLLAGQTFSDKLIHAFCWMLIHSLWQGMLLALVAGIVVVLTKHSAPVLRYRLLSGLFLVFIAAAVASFVWQWQAGSEVSDPLQQAISAPSISAPAGSGPGQPSSVSGLPAVYNNGNAGIPDRTNGLIPPANPLSPNAGSSVTRHTEAGSAVTGSGVTGPGVFFSICERLFAFFNNHAYLLVMIWFVLFTLRCLKIVVNIGYMHRLRYSGVQEPPAYWKTRVRELADRLHIKKTVALLESEIAKVPMMAGFLKPVILIPIGLLAQLPADQVEAVLLHELAHIRRKDYLVNILQHFAEIIFFFNPGVLWLSSLLRDEREHCCDDMAIGQTKNKQQFIHALVSFQEYQLSGSQYAMGFPGSKKGHLLQRVRRIVYNDNKTLDTREKIFLVICLFVTGVLTLAFSQSKSMVADKDSAKKTGVFSNQNISGNSGNNTTDTLPGQRALVDKSDWGKEGIKTEGDVITYYSRGYKIVTADSTVKAFYYRGARIPDEKIAGYADLINQIILEKNLALRGAKVPVGAGMSQEEWDKMQSEKDKEEADLARQLGDLERNRSDLERRMEDIQRRKADSKSMDDKEAQVPPEPEIDAPVPPVPRVSAPVPSISANNLSAPLDIRNLNAADIEKIDITPSGTFKIDPVTLDASEYVEETSIGKGISRVIIHHDGPPNIKDTLPGAESRRLKELQEYERRLVVERVKLDRQQQQLNEEYSKLAQETNRLLVQRVFKEQNNNIRDSVLRRNRELLKLQSSPELQPSLQLREPVQYRVQLLDPSVRERHVVRPVKPFTPEVVNRLIKDLQAEKIITDTLNVSFILNKDVLLVNGIPQSEEVQKKFKDKYIKKEDAHVRYSRSQNGSSISADVHNMDESK